MAEEIDSLEQGELARKWMQQNGSAIVIGVLAAVAILMGYEAWKNSRTNHRGQAGDSYLEMTAAVAENKKDQAVALTGKLAEEYKDTAYAALSQLDASKLAVADSKLDQAIAAAELAVKAAHTDVLADTARLRLARLQSAAGKPVQAQETLALITSEGFKAQVDELRGDALLQQGKSAEALSAYNEAIAGMDVGSPVRNGLQMKIDDLNGGS